jgi:hypothetical protein
VVGQVVNQVVPRFLKQLKTDYETWAGGDDTRAATVGGGGRCVRYCAIPDKRVLNPVSFTESAPLLVSLESHSSNPYNT